MVQVHSTEDESRDIPYDTSCTRRSRAVQVKSPEKSRTRFQDKSYSKGKSRVDRDKRMVFELGLISQGSGVHNLSRDDFSNFG